MWKDCIKANPLNHHIYIKSNPHMSGIADGKGLTSLARPAAAEEDGGGSSRCNGISIRALI